MMLTNGRSRSWGIIAKNWMLLPKNFWKSNRLLVKSSRKYFRRPFPKRAAHLKAHKYLWDRKTGLDRSPVFLVCTHREQCYFMVSYAGAPTHVVIFCRQSSWAIL